MNYSDYFKQKITDLKAAHLYRSLKISDAEGKFHTIQDGQKCISFCSNDYLGLSQNQKVRNAANKAIEKYGFGAGASRFVTGNNSLYLRLEKQLTQIKNCEDAIVFGSGYLTGISVIPALVGKDDLIIADKLIHSCLIDGSKLSGAKLLRFSHNDMAHCRKILMENRANFKKCLIITETVFSMDGDLGNIKELLKLAAEFNCLILADDAHGLGIIENKIAAKYQGFYLQMGTFSKAAGGFGGYICGSQILMDYLRNFARGVIYSTALPPAILAGNLEALRIIKNDKRLGEKALKNANYFCKLMDLPENQSCIVVVIIGEAKQTIKIAHGVTKNGFLVSAIRPPTVEPNKSRLRITFKANHKKADIEKLANLVRLEIAKSSY